MSSPRLGLVVLLGLVTGCEPGVLRTGTNDPGDPGPGGEDERDPADDEDPQGSGQCAAAETVVRGTVTFPSGDLPVAGALVYVPLGEADVPHAGECGECVDDGALLAHAETDAHGAFELVGLPGGTTTIVVEKGRFRRVTAVEVTACQDNVVADEDVRLPGSAAEGEVPRIAVVTGYFDRMQEVLAKLGLSDDSVRLFAGETDSYYGADLPGAEPIGALLHDPDRLATFDIVFINCGALAWDERGPGDLSTDSDVRANLRAFVEAGGRLYVTDLSYDLLEGAFPSLVDYSGAGAGLGGSPEAAGAADSGDDLPALAATVDDAGLREWLDATGSLDGEGITVRGLIGGWAMIDSVDDTRARVWVSGAPPQHDRPLTVTFEAGCGRALFTSYHTVEEEAASPAWTAQEKILAYLVLEIGVCITEPQIF
jgi:hypothetical protein